MPRVARPSNPVLELGRGVCPPTTARVISEASADSFERISVRAEARRRVPSSPRLLVEACYPEGPSWDAANERLLFVEYGADAVSVWRPKDASKRTLWTEQGAGPSSLVRWSDGATGAWLVAAYDVGSLVVLDAEGVPTRRITKDQSGQPTLWPNDFALDGRGGLFFTGSGAFRENAPVEGRVYHLRPGAAPVCVADEIHYSNGLAVTPDGRTLLVAEMFKDRLLAFDVGEASGLSGRRVFADLAALAPSTRYSDPYPLLGPDGLKVTRDGRVFVAHHGTGRVLELSSTGQLRREIEVPHRFVTNVALTPDERHLFVTAESTTEAPHLGGVFLLDIAPRAHC